MTLGGITSVSIILIQRRRKSLNTNNTESRRSTLPEYYEIRETDMSREYESVEDYMKSENDFNLVKNQAYASVHHPSKTQY